MGDGDVQFLPPGVVHSVAGDRFVIAVDFMTR
jgi:hypothetical protein